MNAVSQDWLVRAPAEVTSTNLIDAANHACPELFMRTDADGAVVVIVDQDDRPLLWIQTSRPVAEPATSARRLRVDPNRPPAPGFVDGSDEAGSQLNWWTEVCALDSAADPSLVGRLARAMAEVCGGVADLLSVNAADHTPADTSAMPAAGPYDLLTSRLAVVLQTRPVVALTPWMVTVQDWAASRDLWLVLLTTPGTTLTLGLREQLRRGFGHWVVEEADGFRDGLSGRALEWDGETFAVQETQLWSAALPPGPLIMVETEVVHAYAEDVRIGGLIEDLHAMLGLPRPTTLGLLEPAEAEFDQGVATSIARQRTPESTTFFTSGAGDGVVSVIPQPIGLVERATITFPAEQWTGDESGLLDRLEARGAQLSTIWSTSAGPAAAGSEGSAPSVISLARSRYPDLDPDELAQLGRSDVVRTEVEIGDEYCRVRLPELARQPMPSLLAWSWLAGQLALTDSHVQAFQADAG